LAHALQNYFLRILQMIKNSWQIAYLILALILFNSGAIAMQTSFRNCKKTLIILNEESKTIATDHLLNQIWLASYLYPTLVAASELGLYRELATGAKSINDMALNLKLNPRAVKIILGVLEATQLVKETKQQFGFTLSGQTYLSPESPFYWGGMFSREFANPIVKEIISSATAKESNSPNLDFLLTKNWAEGAMDKNKAEAITESMHAENAATARIQAQALNLKKTKLLDIGSGSGIFSIALAERFPKLTCTLADLPEVLESSKKYVAQSTAQNRIKSLAMDMFRSEWPKDHEAILLSNILHDWDQSVVSYLLKKAYDALPEGGILVINEMLDGSNFEPAAFSIVMLTRTMGQQLGKEELFNALKTVGFSKVEEIKTESVFNLIVAHKKSKTSRGKK
jgi:cyclopropane fatty-acyl-phospholipid synthase-like methyltransferase